MKKRVYVEGSLGMIGAMAREALAGEPEVELLPALPKGAEHDEQRRRLLATADLALVCAEGEALERVEAMIGPSGKILDVSAARRFAPGWVYALTELEGVPERLRGASRAANPGCFASAAILLIEPLARAGLLDRSAPLAIQAVGGYSTGGKKMVDRARAEGFGADALYGAQKPHPHVREIQAACGLALAPAFYPVVGAFERGILAQLSLPKTERLSRASALAAYEAAFAGSATVKALWTEASRLDAAEMAGTDQARVRALESEGIITAVCALDNLGKGGALSAARAAKMMLGLA